MPKQEFTVLDFLGPVVVSIVFFIFCMIFSIVANWTLITPQDDVTKFEKIGRNYNRRWGCPQNECNSTLKCCCGLIHFTSSPIFGLR
ncbi:hypothetical protein M3Y94_00712700 [Aphelenchoides besseyi]|nr:hypothetical protein M3Y94_00712700 [Aphelenchoides besseyi]